MLRCLLLVLRGTQAFKRIKELLAGYSVDESACLVQAEGFARTQKILGISAHACNSSIDGQRGAALDTALASSSS